MKLPSLQYFINVSEKKKKKWLQRLGASAIDRRAVAEKHKAKKVYALQQQR